MERRTLGNTDLTVPVITLGTMTWGIQNTEEDAHAQLSYAVDERGLDFIDTAEIYPIPPSKNLSGTTERFIGSWLAKRGKRDDLIIATKVGSRHQSGSIGTRESTGLSRENVRAAIEGSLSRLGTDYIDLYQVHSPDRTANFWGRRGVEALADDTGAAEIEETYSALVELIKEGKIRHIGLSNETPWGVMQWQRLAREKGWPNVVSIQNQYSLNNRTYEIGLSEVSLREHIGLLAYSPLDGGALSGKYLDGNFPEGARMTLFERNRRYIAPPTMPVTAAYKAVAEKHGLDLAQMALAFCVSRAFVTSVIIGATMMEQLAKDIDAGELVLSPEVFADIDAVYCAHPDPIF